MSDTPETWTLEELLDAYHNGTDRAALDALLQELEQAEQRIEELTQTEDYAMTKLRADLEQAEQRAEKLRGIVERLELEFLSRKVDSLAVALADAESAIRTEIEWLCGLDPEHQPPDIEDALNRLHAALAPEPTEPRCEICGETGHDSHFDGPFVEPPPEEQP